MSVKTKYFIPLFVMLLSITACQHQQKAIDTFHYKDSLPWTRYWWFASEINKEDIRDNLLWLKDNGFGGVEIAWVYPLNRMHRDTLNYTPRQEWLGSEWSAIVAWTKRCADSLGLGCDFTFGTLWPFGDSYVEPHEASQFFAPAGYRQWITASWEYPKKGLVINHLDRNAFYNHADRMGNALKEAFKGSKSAIFVDSWEVECRWLWTDGFDKIFKEKFGYDITPFMDSIYTDAFAHERYDYMKLLSKMVIEEFYEPFTEKARQFGAFSRGQCSGAPCDIISAYARLDVPESEALLYEPAFSNFPASAAALSSKKIVTAETFTCLYGWPRDYLAEEQLADLKLLADALFANGVNHIFWHGKPHNPAKQDTVKFYATVHVGSSGSLAPHIPQFNKYMQKISSFMRKGSSYGKVAVYAPFEDAWIKGDMPIEEQFKWAWGAYEMRYVYLPEELKAYRPMWINYEFLEKAVMKKGKLMVGDLSFEALYVDVAFMDIASLKRIYELATEGLTICLRQIPEEAGRIKHQDFEKKLKELFSYDNVSKNIDAFVKLEKLVSGNHIPDYWCRRDGNDYYFFFANPKAMNIKFPMKYGQTFTEGDLRVPLVFNVNRKTIEQEVVFKPYQSVLLKIDAKGRLSMEDIELVVETPVYIPREKKYPELWDAQR